MIGQILHNNCCRYCFCCVLLPSLLLFLLGIFVVSTTILVAVLSVSIALASAPSWRLSLYRLGSRRIPQCRQEKQSTTRHCSRINSDITSNAFMPYRVVVDNTLMICIAVESASVEREIHI